MRKDDLRMATLRWLALAGAATIAVGCTDNRGNTLPGGSGGRGGSGSGGAGGGGGAGTAGMGGGAGVGLTTLELRGKYLVDHVAACGDCHTPMGQDGRPVAGMYLAGNPNLVALPNGDKLGSRNLTNHETGLKNRTDAEIKDMFLNGVRPTAAGMEPLHPLMPYYVLHNMTEADADAIVAYLRTVPPVEQTIPRRDPSFDVPAAARPVPVAAIPLPRQGLDDDVRESAMRGRYLAGQIGVCMECHTAHLPPGSPTVLDEEKLFAGGEDFSALFAGTLNIKPVSKNITSHMGSGIGMWEVADLVRALKEGKAKDGSGICPPMPVGPNGAFGGLTDADATDIANYLKSLPPINNMIPDMCTWPPMGGPGGAGGTGAGAGGASGGAGGGAGGASGGAAGATGA